MNRTVLARPSLSKLLLPVAIGFFCFTTTITMACSRLTYTGPDNTVITGRSMDWSEDIKTDLWAFPAGMQRKGDASSHAVQWTSKYGTVVASGYNLGTADGINTQGLTANLLYLSSADYGKPQPDHKDLSVLHWAQYVLDNYATVKEVVEGLRAAQFNMISPVLPNGASASLHLAVTDASGDNAIFEHINGKLVIHHGKEYKVMTNEPTYDKQLALTDYWKRLNGQFLPGTSEPDDRFVRASYYLGIVPETSDEQQAVATVFSIIRNVSAPIGQNQPGKPNVSSTLWRCVADLRHGIYFFESTNRPNVFWVDLHHLDLKQKGRAMRLPLAENQIYAGEVSKSFVIENPPY
jgi:penicillin V acylase-like amidase (Ntn superfamily)